MFNPANVAAFFGHIRAQKGVAQHLTVISIFTNTRPAVRQGVFLCPQAKKSSDFFAIIRDMRIFVLSEMTKR